jgi:carbamoyltransferase
VPFAAWEQPAAAARWCLRQAGLSPADVDLIGFSYDPALVRSAAAMGLDDPWDNLRTLYATHAPQFLAEELPGLDPARTRFVRHHVAHAASAGLAAGPPECTVLVCDGRGEQDSFLGGRYRAGQLEILAARPAGRDQRERGRTAAGGPGGAGGRAEPGGGAGRADRAGRPRRRGRRRVDGD